MSTQEKTNAVQTQDDRATVAREILRHLGDNQFVAMTGARDFVTSSDGISFRLPGRSPRIKANHVSIAREAANVYRVDFGALTSRGGYRLLARFSGVWGSQLRNLFSETTGLDTRL